jgi:hypothetical protein
MNTFRYRQLVRLGAILCASLAYVPPVFAETGGSTFQVGLVVRVACNIDKDRASIRSTPSRGMVTCSRPVPYRVETSEEVDVPSPHTTSLDPSPEDGAPATYTVVF